MKSSLLKTLKFIIYLFIIFHCIASMFPFVAVAGRRRNPIINFLFITTTSTTTTNNPSSLLNKTHLLLLLLSRSLHHKPITKEEEKPNLNDSSSLTTVSYLINSCGLSPQSALSASKRINIKTTMKPDSNLALFKSHGFSDAHITKLIAVYPRLLLSKWDKTIKPKLDYFISLGYSETDLTALVSSNPELLKSSLQRKIKHNLDLLRPIFGTNQQILLAVRRSSGKLLTVKVEAKFLPNVRILHSCGVPSSHIAMLATRYPRSLMQTTSARFKTMVDLLGKMGFNPLSTMFIHGIGAMTSMNPSIWERKSAFFKSMGWSEAEFISAFRKQPTFLPLSEEKIKRVMDFSVEKMNWGPSFVAERPVLLNLSLEKRIIPRCSVMRILESKGLVARTKGADFLIRSETDFLNKYVIKYQDQVPELLQAYKGNSEFLGL